MAELGGQAIIDLPSSRRVAKSLSNPILAPGKRAPAFTLPSDQGQTVRLTEHRGRWVVLFFFPRSLSPTCCQEVCDFQKALPDFQQLGAVVFGVNAEEHERHAEFRHVCKLSFPLLRDRDAKLAIRYGVFRERKTSGRRYLSLVRSTFLIDPSGKVCQLWDNLRVKGHVVRVLAKLREERLL